MAKFRYPLILFATSFVVLFVGILFKISHWPGGRLLTFLAYAMQALSLVWLLILLLPPNKKL
ncbi:MAG: hypothetical protein ACHQHN_15055 [Sphingobacteriales bacterium]